MANPFRPPLPKPDPRGKPNPFEELMKSIMGDPDWYANSLPREGRYDIGVAKLKKEFLRRAGVDVDTTGPYDDSATNMDVLRKELEGRGATYGGLKRREREFEYAQRGPFNPDMWAGENNPDWRNSEAQPIVDKNVLRNKGVDVDQRGPYNDTPTIKERLRQESKGNWDFRKLKRLEKEIERKQKTITPGLPYPPQEGVPRDPTIQRKAQIADKPPANFDTPLTAKEEQQFQAWKKRYAPHDSGEDYDLRGAFKNGLKPGTDGHWPDTFKKPNHPTFSDESIYAPYGKPGRWEGDTFIPAQKMADQEIDDYDKGDGLYTDEDGYQRTLRNDKIIEKFRGNIDDMASSATPKQQELLKRYLNESYEKWTEADQKELQPFLDKISPDVKKLPGSTFDRKNNQIIMHNWRGLFLQELERTMRKKIPGASIDDGAKELVQEAMKRDPVELDLTSDLAQLREQKLIQLAGDVVPLGKQPVRPDQTGPAQNLEEQIRRIKSAGDTSNVRVIRSPQR